MPNFDYETVWEYFLHQILCMVFQETYFLLYSIKWPNIVACLPLLPTILNNICIVITCCPVWDVINFEINLSFLLKPFFSVTKKSGQIFKYLRNEKSIKYKKYEIEYEI